MTDIVREAEEIKYKYVEPVGMPEKSEWIYNAAGMVVGFKRVEKVTLEEFKKRYPKNQE